MIYFYTFFLNFFNFSSRFENNYSNCNDQNLNNPYNHYHNHSSLSRWKSFVLKRREKNLVKNIYFFHKIHLRNIKNQIINQEKKSFFIYMKIKETSEVANNRIPHLSRGYSGNNIINESHSSVFLTVLFLYSHNI